jgi:hypothetical protein
MEINKSQIRQIFYIMTQGCCNYGSLKSSLTKTANTKAWDCLQIPGAKKATGGSILNNFCGGRLVAINSATTSSTICSKKTNFTSVFNECTNTHLSVKIGYKKISTLFTYLVQFLCLYFISTMSL